jgi:hypothetical protein
MCYGSTKLHHFSIILHDYRQLMKQREFSLEERVNEFADELSKQEKVLIEKSCS